MDTLEPDAFTYPASIDSLRAAFRREMEMFVDSVFREDRSVMDLLNANYTFVNERLAAHYGIENVRGDQFRRVTLTDPNRFGLLGKGAVLMVTAYPNRTSPVLRGAYILENIMGTPPSPPPPNVEAFKENKEGEQPKTIREIMETHRANPTCNACHGVMDPLGFSLENFDTIGAYRSMDRFTRTKIDTSGKLVDGTAVNGPSDLRKALLKHPEQFAQTFTEKLMTYALGRGIEYFDMPTVRKIVKDARTRQLQVLIDRDGNRSKRRHSSRVWLNQRKPSNRPPASGRQSKPIKGASHMFVTKKHLTRRTVLRGAGTALALPLLDAMIPARTALAQTAAKATPHLGFIYFPHGAVQDQVDAHGDRREWASSATSSSRSINTRR